MRASNLTLFKQLKQFIIVQLSTFAEHPSSDTNIFLNEDSWRTFLTRPNDNTCKKSAHEQEWVAVGNKQEYSETLSNHPAIVDTQRSTEVACTFQNPLLFKGNKYY
jgi:hypothetical protein